MLPKHSRPLKEPNRQEKARSCRAKRRQLYSSEPVGTWASLYTNNGTWDKASEKKEAVSRGGTVKHKEPHLSSDCCCPPGLLASKWQSE